MSSPDPLKWTHPFQLTKTIRRDPYAAISSKDLQTSAKGKIIVITGGGSGIGAAAGHVWAREGAEGVVLAGRRIKNLEDNAAEIRAAYPEVEVLCVATDLLDDQEVKRLFEKTSTKFGRSPDVVLANAGVVEDALIGEHDTEEWWNIMSINLKGAFSTAHHFINTQADPQNPVGTFIVTNSGLAGAVVPGVSAYAISKLGAQRLIEYMHVEYPSLRSFTLIPGIVMTPIVSDQFKPFAFDHADLSGMLAIYLASSRGDWLRGLAVSINWDIEEMEAQKEKLVKEDMLKIKWMPVLPISGGSGI